MEPMVCLSLAFDFLALQGRGQTGHTPSKSVSPEGKGTIFWVTGCHPQEQKRCLEYILYMIYHSIQFESSIMF